MFNVAGTIIRVFSLLCILLFLWLIVITAIYYVAILVLGIEFSLKNALIIFTFIMIIRSLYPRNIFK